MSETITDPQSAQSDYEVEEEEGYDVPFALFTWKQWQTMQRFTRFQRAIEHGQARLAIQIVLGMQQMTLEWLKEANSWVKINRL